MCKQKTAKTHKYPFWHISIVESKDVLWVTKVRYLQRAVSCTIKWDPVDLMQKRENCIGDVPMTYSQENIIWDPDYSNELLSRKVWIALDFFVQV